MFPTKPTFCALEMNYLMGGGCQGRRMKEINHCQQMCVCREQL